MASETTPTSTAKTAPGKPRDHAASLLASFDAGDLNAMEAEAGQLLSVGGTPPDLLRLFAMLAEKVNADSVAEKFYNRLVKLNPTLPGQHRKLGQIQLRLGQRGAAMRTLNAALSVDKTDSEARTLLAGLLNDLGRQDEARKHYRTVTEQNPENAGAWLKLAQCYCITNRYQEGIEAFDKAIAIDDTRMDAHIGKAEALLASGDFGQGWSEYTWRPGGKAVDASGKTVTRIPSFSGKHVLLRQEDHLSETVLGLRYAPLLRESGARVTLAVDRKYMPLLLDSDLSDDMIEPDATETDCDIEMKLLTAPSFLRAGGTTQPLASGYLNPVAKSPKVAEKGLRVGIALRAPGNRDETIPVARLREVLTIPAPVSFISLENTGAEDFRSINWAEGRVKPATGDMDDPRQLAAALSEVDLVIAAGGEVGHIAGAMGIRCWIVLPVNSNWMWGTSGDRTAWYNSIRIFRQTVAGRWSKPLESLRKSLLTLATVVDDPAMTSRPASKTPTASGES